MNDSYRGPIAQRYTLTESLPNQQVGSDGRPPVVALTVGTTPCNATELIEQHLALVSVLVAERLQHVPDHVRRDELMSAGMLALVLSAGAFDAARGVSFKSFATFRIRGALIDELRAMDWASRSVRTRAREMETVRARLTTALNRPPVTGEMATALGVDVRELDSVVADTARGTVLSLHGCAAAELPDPTNRSECPESLILRREKLGYLHDAIGALPERLQYVVLAHFFGHRKMSDIAVEMSVSQSRVSQLCTEAVALIRDGMNSQLDPDALAPPSLIGRAGAARSSYYRTLADRNTLAGRLDMSTAGGEMRRGIATENIAAEEATRIA